MIMIYCYLKNELMKLDSVELDALVLMDMKWMVLE